MDKRDITEAELKLIDDAILSASTNQWRKASRVIGMAMAELSAEFRGVPDAFYFQRINLLIQSGVLAAQGNQLEMQFCEICNASNVET